MSKFSIASREGAFTRGEENFNLLSARLRELKDLKESLRATEEAADPTDAALIGILLGRIVTLSEKFYR